MHDFYLLDEVGTSKTKKKQVRISCWGSLTLPKVNLTKDKVSPCCRLVKLLWPETSASVSFQRRG